MEAKTIEEKLEKIYIFLGQSKWIENPETMEKIIQYSEMIENIIQSNPKFKIFNEDSFSKCITLGCSGAYGTLDEKFVSPRLIVNWMNQYVDNLPKKEPKNKEDLQQTLNILEDVFKSDFCESERVKHQQSLDALNYVSKVLKATHEGNNKLTEDHKLNAGINIIYLYSMYGTVNLGEFETLTDIEKGRSYLFDNPNKLRGNEFSRYVFERLVQNESNLDLITIIKDYIDVTLSLVTKPELDKN